MPVSFCVALYFITGETSSGAVLGNSYPPPGIDTAWERILISWSTVELQKRLIFTLSTEKAGAHVGTTVFSKQKTTNRYVL